MRKRSLLVLWEAVEKFGLLNRRATLAFIVFNQRTLYEPNKVEESSCTAQ